MKFRFFTCDVFTQTRFGGNPLAVLPDARGLSEAQMQAIAREFNYSETTFVFPPAHGGTRQVRIFTPSAEVPFAGHPNVGTAFVLSQMGEFGSATQIQFEEKAGMVPITLDHKPDGNLVCELRAPQPLTRGKTFSAQSAAAALSLPLEDIVTTSHFPQVASVGLPFIMIELRTRDALARARPMPGQFQLLHIDGFEANAHLYVRSNDEFDLRTRMFFDMGGTVIEDPATGSANCALAGLLSLLDPRTEASFSFRIAQGVEMRRPSILLARTHKAAGAVDGIWISGNCVQVSEGVIQT